MDEKEIVALLLAGGKGSRLGVLTDNIAKPAVPFAGDYRIIDFTLSNCSNSGIDTVGVLTQYKPLELNKHIGIGNYWDLDRMNGGVTILPPYTGTTGGNWYQGTANAVYRNLDYVDKYNPEFVLILSGDHIYKMDYSRMVDFHKSKKADVTIAVVEVPLAESSRFGIISTDNKSKITDFQEKPQQTESNLASMGIYLFNWKTIKKYLLKYPQDIDFGHNVIPRMLNNGLSMFAYPYQGYWKDVGTIESYWQAHMELLQEEGFNLYDSQWPIFSAEYNYPPQYIADKLDISNSLIAKGCKIKGSISNSVISHGTSIASNAVVESSVVMPNVRIGSNTIVYKTIVGNHVYIGDNCKIGGNKGVVAQNEITVIGDNYYIPDNIIICCGQVIGQENISL